VALAYSSLGTPINYVYNIFCILQKLCFKLNINAKCSILNLLREMSRPMTKRIEKNEKFVSISVRYPEHLKIREQLSIMAIEESRSLNGQVQRLLLEAIALWKIRKNLVGKRLLAYEEFKQDLLKELNKS